MPKINSMEDIMSTVVEIYKWNTDREGMLFCINALNQKSFVIQFSHVLIRNGYAYGTDGMRMNRYKLNNKYSNGLYRVLKSLKYHIVLLKTDNKISSLVNTKGLFNKSKNKFDARCYKNNYFGTLSTIIRNLPEDRTINPDYLKELDFSGDGYLSDDRILICNDIMASLFATVIIDQNE